ncbi:MAG: flavodoxin family protein [Firmicutes bacterium]|nr:flavodoxin family protein [Bacillota bacterium]
MQVAAFNGSPNKEGNTYHALKTVAAELEKAGIATEIIQVGNKLIRGCLACGKCAKNKNEKCVTDDEVNQWIQKIKAADGIIFGSPVHYASIGATMKAFLDRAFYVAGANGNLFRHKVGAAVVAVRRTGGMTALDQLNHYLTYAEMLVPTANYWNVIHGATPGEALQDLEGMQIMGLLGKNMAWLLKLVENGKGAVQAPAPEAKVRMNFIR